MWRFVFLSTNSLLCAILSRQKEVYAQMYFVIDYENVQNTGMRGTEYLLPTDHVIVFYSNAVPNMEAQYLTGIKDSGCEFEVCKLIKAHKNALDFYIATKVGAIFGAGYSGKIAIVSRDEGFQAVRDYWSSCAVPPHRILLSENIERGIISANEPNERTKIIHAKLKNLDISSFFSAYEEEQKLRKLLAEAFEGTEFAARTGEMEDILRGGKTPRVIYLDTLRHFGRKDGVAVYKKLKVCTEI